MTVIEFIIIACGFTWFIGAGVIGAVIYYICEDEKGIDPKRLFWLLVFCGPLCWVCVGVIKVLLYFENKPNLLMRFLKNG